MRNGRRMVRKAAPRARRRRWELGTPGPRCRSARASRACAAPPEERGEGVWEASSVRQNRRKWDCTANLRQLARDTREGSKNGSATHQALDVRNVLELPRLQGDKHHVNRSDALHLLGSHDRREGAGGRLRGTEYGASVCVSAERAQAGPNCRPERGKEGPSTLSHLSVAADALERDSVASDRLQVVPTRNDVHSAPSLRKPDCKVSPNASCPDNRDRVRLGHASSTAHCRVGREVVPG